MRVPVGDILKMLTIDRKPEEVAVEFEIPLEAVYDALRLCLGR